MADIRVEKKKPVWPWLILIIILIAVVFLYFYGSSETEETDDLETSEIEEVTINEQNRPILQIKGIRV